MLDPSTAQNSVVGAAGEALQRRKSNQNELTVSESDAEAAGGEGRPYKRVRARERDRMDWSTTRIRPEVAASGGKGGRWLHRSFLGFLGF